MRASNFCVYNNNRIQGEDLTPVNVFNTHCGLGCCPFLCGGSVVVDSLFYAHNLVRGGSMCWFLFCYITMCPF